MAIFKNNNEIPTSNNIFKQIIELNDNFTKIIKSTIENGLKPKDLVKLKFSMALTKKAVKQIFKGYMEIQAVLAAARSNETIDLMTELVTDPVSFIKNIKNDKLTVSELEEQRKDKSVKILNEYANIIKIIAELSKFGESISLKGLKKLPKNTGKAVDMLISALNVLKRKSRRLKVISKAIIKPMQVIPVVMDTLMRMTSQLDLFINTAKKYKKGKIKAIMGNFFATYVFIAIEMFKLGKFMITGRYEFTDKVLGFIKTKKSINFNPIFLWVGIALGYKFIQLIDKLVKVAMPLINKLAKIGDNQEAVAQGMMTLQLIFTGRKKFLGRGGVKSIAEIINQADLVNPVKLLLFLAMSTLMTPIAVETAIIAKALAAIAEDKKAVKKGISVFDVIFNSKKSKSFINIVNNAAKAINKNAVKNALILLGYLTIATVITFGAVLMAKSLGMLNESKKDIKNGLKAFKMMLFAEKKKFSGIIILSEAVATRENIIKNILLFTGVAFLLTISLKVYEKTVQSLFVFHLFRKQAKKGMKALLSLLTGKDKTDEEGNKKIKHFGLLDIVEHVATSAPYIWYTLKFTAFAMLTGIAFKYFQYAIDGLVELGNNKRKAVKGIKALNRILFGKSKEKKDKKIVKYRGIVDIIADEDLAKLNIKDVAIAGLKILMLGAVFTGFGLMLSLFGIFSAASVLAIIAILVSNFVIKRMLKGLRTIEESGLNIKKLGKELVRLGKFYTRFIMMLKIVATNMNMEEMKNVHAVIMMSPKTIEKMLEGLEHISKTDIKIKKTGKTLIKLTGIYAAYINILKVLSKDLDKEKILDVYAILESSPMIIRTMILGLKIVEIETKKFDFKNSKKILMQLVGTYTVFINIFKSLSKDTDKEKILEVFSIIETSPGTIATMLSSLKIIDNMTKKFDYEEASKKLIKLTTTFTIFISLFKSLSKDIQREKMLEVLSIIETSPGTIATMLSGLKVIDKMTKKFDFEDSKDKLMTLIKVYSKFLLLITAVSKNISSEDARKTLGILYISPIIIRRMCKGLKVIHKKTKEINFKKASHNLLMMTKVYSEYLLLITAVAKNIDLEDTKKTLGILYISPIIIRRMCKGLKIINRKTKSINIDRNANTLMSLSIAYSKFLLLITATASNIDMMDSLKAMALIYLSPLIIRRMCRGLKIINRKLKGVNVTKMVAVMQQMCVGYAALVLLVSEAGNKLSVKGILKALLFFLISPIIIKLMTISYRILNIPKIKTAVTIGSAVLVLMCTSMVAFAGSMLALSTIVAGLSLAILFPFAGFVLAIGAVMALIGILSPFILLGSVTMIVMSVALILLSASLIVLSVALLLLATSFAAIQKIMPSDDVITETVNGLVKMINGIGRILRAIVANIVGKGFAAMLSILFISIMLLLLRGTVKLFISISKLTTQITDEMSLSIIHFSAVLTNVVKEIANGAGAGDIIKAFLKCIGYTFIMVLLTITATLVLGLNSIVSKIDYTKLEMNLGVGEKNKDGLIPILGSLVAKIDDLIDGKAVFFAIFKIFGLMAVVTALTGVAAIIKGMATLEIEEYKDGHSTGKKILMQKSDFARAQENMTDILTSVVSIFYDKNGNETEVVKLIDKLKGKTVLKTAGLKMIISSISGIAKIIAKMSKLTVPDDEKGFDTNGKPLGWRQLNKGDFDNFKENVLTMMGVITAIFDENNETGKSFANCLNNVERSTRKKMKIMNGIIKQFGELGEVISKMSQVMVPDFGEDGNSGFDPNTGKILKWKKLDDDTINKCQTQIVSLFGIFGTIIDQVKDSDLKEVKNRTLNKLSSVMDCITPISNLIDTIIKMATSQFPLIKLNDDGTAKKDAKGNIITEYKNFSEIPFETAVSNITTIFWKYLDGIGGICSNNKWQHRIKDINKVMKDGINVGGISDLIDNIIKLATGQFPMMDLDANGHAQKDSSGNVIMKYIRIGNTEIEAASKNIASILLGYVNNVSSVIMDANGKTTEFSAKMKTISDAFTGSSGVFTMLTPMVENMTKIAGITSADVEKFKSNITSLAKGYNQAVTALVTPEDGKENPYKLWTAIRDPFNDFVYSTNNLYGEMKDSAIPTNVKNTVISINDLLSKVTKMDDGKLGKMVSLSENMAKFSTSINGNFDSLAKAMNENIITALDKVDKSMQALKEYLETEFSEDLGETVKEAMESVTISVTGGGGSETQGVNDLVTDPNKEKLPTDDKSKKIIEEYNKKLNELKTIMSKLSGCVDNNKLKVKVLQ